MSGLVCFPYNFINNNAEIINVLEKPSKSKMFIIEYSRSGAMQRQRVTRNGSSQSGGNVRSAKIKRVVRKRRSGDSEDCLFGQRTSDFRHGLRTRILARHPTASQYPDRRVVFPTIARYYGEIKNPAEKDLLARRAMYIHTIWTCALTVLRENKCASRIIAYLRVVCRCGTRMPFPGVSREKRRRKRFNAPFVLFS